MATTARWALRFPVLADTADVPRDIGNLASDLDNVAKDDQGTLAARPTAVAAKRGFYYAPTDEAGVIYRSDATNWFAVGGRQPNGTSGAPAYSFAAETTLGFWRAGAGIIELRGSGSLKVVGGQVQADTFAPQTTGDFAFIAKTNRSNWLIFNQAGASTQRDFTIGGDGGMAWGPGSAVPDVSLVRSAAGQLRMAGISTVGTFQMYSSAGDVTQIGTGYMLITRDSGNVDAIAVTKSSGGVAEANPVYRVAVSGSISWGPGGAVALDTTISRGGAAATLQFGSSNTLFTLKAEDTTNQRDLLIRAGNNSGASGTGGQATLQAGSGGSTAGNGGLASVKGGAAGGNAPGGVAELLGGLGSGNGTGGLASIVGGTSGSSAGSSGGGVVIQGGTPGNVTGNGGGITIAGRDGGSTAGTGGAIDIHAGAGGPGTAGGAVTVAGGIGGSAAAGGTVLVTGGIGLGASAAGGSATLRGGQAGASGNANGGDVNLTTGAGIGTGVAGVINASAAIATATNSGTATPAKGLMGTANPGDGFNSTTLSGTSRFYSHYGIVWNDNQLQMGAFGDVLIYRNGSEVCRFSNNTINQLLINSAVSTVSQPIRVGTSTANGNAAFLTAAGAWTTGTSKSSFKTGIENLDGDDMLTRISKLQISEWNYKPTSKAELRKPLIEKIKHPDDPYDEESFEKDYKQHLEIIKAERHISPMAESWYKEFPTLMGDEDTHIALQDMSGVALVGIQALTRKVRELEERIAALN